jgi:hypothetical protein
MEAIVDFAEESMLQLEVLDADFRDQVSCASATTIRLRFRLREVGDAGRGWSCVSESVADEP